MLRISKLTDYATVILAHLAEDESARYAAAELAGRTGIGVATVSKLLKELSRAGLVVATRGPRGGYALARPAAAISAADIIDAVEGPVGLTECATQPGQCGIESTCRVGRSWQRVNVAIRRALYDVKLTQLTGRDATVIAAPDLGAAVEHRVAFRPSMRVRA
ncbi:MAG: SUF system Fe-S cluster assembly regulator [Steroidobacteraceae bacterium]|nr:SUF system Fe-S cluster assembly regulator [Steroidobacteraceae bacterium]